MDRVDPKGKDAYDDKKQKSTNARKMTTNSRTANLCGLEADFRLAVNSEAVQTLKLGRFVREASLSVHINELQSLCIPARNVLKCAISSLIGFR